MAQATPAREVNAKNELESSLLYNNNLPRLAELAKRGSPQDKWLASKESCESAAMRRWPPHGPLAPKDPWLHERGQEVIEYDQSLQVQIDWLVFPAWNFQEPSRLRLSGEIDSVLHSHSNHR